MVKTCLKCGACNNNEDNFCKICGSHFRVPSEALRKVICQGDSWSQIVRDDNYCGEAHRHTVFGADCRTESASSPHLHRAQIQTYEDLHRSIGDLSSRNQTLEQQLQKTTDELKALTGQLRTDEQTHRMDVERQFSERNKVLEEQLAKAMTEIRSLGTQVRANEEAHRVEVSKTMELVEANRRLLHEVRRSPARSRFCTRCGRHLSTVNPNVDLCPVCGVTSHTP